MQNNKPISYIEEGEIHIRELKNLLINSKKLIIVVTLFFSLMATIYIYSKEPEYEASAVIEVGSYINSNNHFNYIEKPQKVVEDLTIQFIKIPNQTTGNSILHSVNFLGNQYIVMKSISTSPDTAIKNVENVQQFLTKDHQKKLGDEKKKLDVLLTSNQDSIDTHYRGLDMLKLKFIQLTNEKQILALSIDKNNTLLKEFDEKIKILKPSDYDLSGSIQLLTENENKKISELITSQKLKLESYDSAFKRNEHQEEDLEKQIQDRLDEITRLNSIIQRNGNYVTPSFSEITTEKLPRKIYIIIASFVAGFFFSIFLVIIRQAFLQEQK